MLGAELGRQTAAAIVGFSSGFLVAGGVVALMVGLGITRRFAGITHTAVHARLYETMIVLGGIGGNLLTVYQPVLGWGRICPAAVGLFSRIFVGGWILALAELLNVFPVFARRLGIVKGKSWVMIALALGKTAGSLLLFAMRWGK